MSACINVNKDEVKTEVKYDAAYNLSKTFRINLDKGVDGWIVVSSPDIKSLVTQGKDEDDAIKNALEVIGLLIEEKEVNKDIRLVFYSSF